MAARAVRLSKVSVSRPDRSTAPGRDPVSAPSTMMSVPFTITRAMPFPPASVGAFVFLDVLHHLPRPLDFLAEASRALVPGGVVAMIEPWITPASYLLYRYFHHEDCTLRIDIRNPFDSTGKKAFDGNATIPYNLVRHYARAEAPPLKLVRFERFLGLPYLATLGFKRTRPLPPQLIGIARGCEKVLGPIGRWNATRALMVWEKPG